MKGLLKIYHPEETLRYTIESSYCKALYANEVHTLELEIITNDSLDHVEDDSLQYQFPKIQMNIFDFPLKSADLEGEKLEINDTEDDVYTEVILDGSDDEAYIYDNQFDFSKNEEGVLEVIWRGKIDDIFTNSDDPVDFKLKCHFKEDGIEIGED